MATGTQLVQEARRFLGDPYVYGAAGPNSFDCSGLVQYSLGQLGIKAPRTAAAQWAWSQHITRDQLQPGDLIFEEPSSSGPGHVVIYAGGDQVVEAPHTGTNVRVRSWSPSESIVGYGRPRGLGASTGDKLGTIANGLTGGAIGAAGNILQVPDQISNAFGAAEQFAQGALWLVNPENWARIMAGFFGVILLIGGLFFLAGAA